MSATSAGRARLRPGLHRGRRAVKAPPRALMSDHHLSARLWATAALLAALPPVRARFGWWLPLHLGLAGAATQLIAGGQLMFSATLALGRAPPRKVVVGQLLLLQAGAAAVVAGRLAGVPALLAVGGAVFFFAIAWSAILVRRIWAASLGARFTIVRTFYSLASIGMLAGAAAGMTMGAARLHPDTLGYLRLAHQGMNLFGWAGLTIIGTIVTLLPTVLGSPAREVPLLRAVPWVYVCGVVVMLVGLRSGSEPLAAAGAVVLAAALVPVARLVGGAVRSAPRPVPALSGIHLIACLGWLAVTVAAQPVLLARGSTVAVRDLWLVGLAGGFVFQSILGAWVHLLPSARPWSADRVAAERRVLQAGAFPQALAYNGGLVLLLAAGRGGVPGGAGAVGLTLVLGAVGWALLKSWTFPFVARRAGPENRQGGVRE